ncbi:hypothetical protein B0H34DRAFT_736080, partial [Crassisporium funariophilum]
MPPTYNCDCVQYCMRGGRETAKAVSRSTYVAHAPYRADPALLPARPPVRVPAQSIRSRHPPSADNPKDASARHQVDFGNEEDMLPSHDDGDVNMYDEEGDRSERDEREIHMGNWEYGGEGNDDQDELFEGHGATDSRYGSRKPADGFAGAQAGFASTV